MILLWTLIYFLNLAAVLLVQYHLIYTIPTPHSPQEEAAVAGLLAEKDRFDGYEILDLANGYDRTYVLCRNAAGEQVIVTLKNHTIFHRSRLTLGETPVTGEHVEIDMDGVWGSRHVAVADGQFTASGGLALFQWNGRDVIPAMLLALIPFLLEILIYNRIRALLR